MRLDTIGQTLKRKAQLKLVSRCARIGTCVLALGIFVAWRVTGSHALASPKFAAATPLFECTDGCPPGYHCSRVETGYEQQRACEPDTTLQATVNNRGKKSVKVVLSPLLPPPNPGAPPIQLFKTWTPPGVDGMGCPLSSYDYGAYPLGKDGKCHWCPKNAYLREDNKCECLPGFNPANVNNKGKKDSAGKHFKCEKQ